MALTRPCPASTSDSVMLFCAPLQFRSVMPCAGTDVFCNPAELLHITLFHCSHPHDPRPQSLDKEESDAIAKLPLSQRRAPTKAEISAEVALMPKILGDRAVDPVKVGIYLIARFLQTDLRSTQGHDHDNHLAT